MTLVIQSVLAMISQFLPLLGSSSAVSTIQSIINALKNLVPLIVDEVQLVTPAIKNIIAALSANPATTADQLAQLKALDAQVDAAFDEAAKDTDAGI